MSATSEQTWTDMNQQSLTTALSLVRTTLERHAAGEAPAPDAEADAARKRIGELADAMPAPPALDVVSSVFGLSSFERDILLMCAGFELEASFFAVCAEAAGGSARSAPTFGLAMAALPGAHWSAVSPSAPLRRWRLVEVGSGSSLATSPLRIDEAVLHHLTGLGYFDERLAGFVTSPPRAEAPLAPSLQQVAGAVAQLWSSADGPAPVVQLCGPDGGAKREIAAAAGAMVGLDLSVLPAHVIPAGPHELDELIRLWERGSALRGAALLVEADELTRDAPDRAAVVRHFLEHVRGVLLLACRERWRLGHRTTCVFEVGKPTTDEQRTLWLQSLSGQNGAMNGHVDRLVSHFDLSARDITTAARQALVACDQPAALPKHLWTVRRTQARPRLDDLAQRVEPAATWSNLILPDDATRALRDAAIHVRRRRTVYDEWGFATACSRGLGISALFVGESGTGKTMAAEVLAHDLELDLYIIDLSRVVSKYIGETEKNLGRVFDAAEDGGAILLFDEADALFGKRSEVRDSHDRYANIEVSYLLQRMESYRGLACLTTNMKSAIDDAFMRRIRFVVAFPFPNAGNRARIWGRIFPGGTPTEGLDVEKLSRLNVTGGNIRNIALHAAFIAAEADEPVRMGHLLAAARREYAKLEKPLTDMEIRGWQ